MTKTRERRRIFSRTAFHSIPRKYRFDSSKRRSNAIAKRPVLETNHFYALTDKKFVSFLIQIIKSHKQTFFACIKKIPRSFNTFDRWSTGRSHSWIGRWRIIIKSERLLQLMSVAIWTEKKTLKNFQKFWTSFNSLTDFFQWVLYFLKFINTIKLKNLVTTNSSVNQKIQNFSTKQNRRMK